MRKTPTLLPSSIGDDDNDYVDSKEENAASE